MKDLDQISYLNIHKNILKFKYSQKRARQSKAIRDQLFEQAKITLKELGRSGEGGRRLQVISLSKIKGNKGSCRDFLMDYKSLSSAGCAQLVICFR